MKKIGLKIGALLCVSVFLSGCSSAIPELTKEQQDLVVEYAASTLLKYNKNYEGRLLEKTELEAEEAKITAREEKIAQMQKEKLEKAKLNQKAESSQGKEGAASGEDTNDNFQADVNTSATIEDFLNLDQVTFTYVGYEIADDYPEQGENLFFVMNATEGKKLLVLKFKAENVSSTEAVLNMSQVGARYKVSVDGEEKNALTTMLLNDMAYYQGTIAAGECTELVVVSEIPVEKAESISILELIVKNVDNTTTILLN